MEGEKIEKDQLDILACPKCRHNLVEEKDILICYSCSMKYPVIEGIPVLLLENAEPFAN